MISAFGGSFPPFPFLSFLYSLSLSHSVFLLLSLCWPSSGWVEHWALRQHSSPARAKHSAVGPGPGLHLSSWDSIVIRGSDAWPVWLSWTAASAQGCMCVCVLMRLHTQTHTYTQPKIHAHTHMLSNTEARTLLCSLSLSLSLFNSHTHKCVRVHTYRHSISTHLTSTYRHTRCICNDHNLTSPHTHYRYYYLHYVRDVMFSSHLTL